MTVMKSLSGSEKIKFTSPKAFLFQKNEEEFNTGCWIYWIEWTVSNAKTCIKTIRTHVT